MPIGQRFCAEHAAAAARASGARSDERRKGRPSRRWYSSAAWQRRRRLQLAREPLCRFCAKRGVTKLASVADHIQPHRDDWELFWRGELQSLCSSCHASAKQIKERAAARGAGQSLVSAVPRHDTPTVFSRAVEIEGGGHGRS